MKTLATFTVVAMLASGAIAGANAQTSATTRPSETPPVGQRAPGTAATDVAPGRSMPNAGADAGAPSKPRQREATRGEPMPPTGDARRANRDRGASAAQSYGYPPSSPQGR